MGRLKAWPTGPQKVLKAPEWHVDWHCALLVASAVINGPQAGLKGAGGGLLNFVRRAPLVPIARIIQFPL